MKKLLAAALASAMMLSFAACEKKDVTPTCEGGTETTPGSETGTTATASSEDVTTVSSEYGTTTAAPGDSAISKYVRDCRDTYKHLEREDGKYHAPEILIDSEYAKSINEEIARRFENYDAALVKDGFCHYTSTKYTAYLTKEGVLCVVFVECGDCDDDIYHLYNIDVQTGGYVDNKRIAEIAGISDIAKAAKDAVQAYYNATGNVKIENYKVVKDNGEPLNYMEKQIEDSFLGERLNENMMIGITSEGTMFFISALGSFGGADWYYRMYDVNGVLLDNADIPNWVKG